MPEFDLDAFMQEKMGENKAEPTSNETLPSTEGFDLDSFMETKVQDLKKKDPTLESSTSPERGSTSTSTSTVPQPGKIGSEKSGVETPKLGFKVSEIFGGEVKEDVKEYEDRLKKAKSMATEFMSDPKEKAYTENLVDLIEKQYSSGGSLTPHSKLIKYYEDIKPIEEAYLSTIGDRFPTEQERDTHVADMKNIAAKYGLDLKDDGSVSVPKADMDFYSEAMNRGMSKLGELSPEKKTSYLRDFDGYMGAAAADLSANMTDFLGWSLAFNAIPGYDNLSENARAKAELYRAGIQRQDIGITDAAQEGEYGKAVANLGLQFAGAIPQLIGYSLGSYAGAGSATSVFMGGTSATGRYKELENVDMSTAAKILNSALYGAAEVVPEHFGTYALMNASMGAMKRGMTKQAVFDVMKQGYKTQLEKGMSGIMGGMTASFKGGIEEVATAIPQNILDGKPAYTGIGDQFIVGMFTDALISSPKFAVDSKDVAKGMAQSMISKIPKDLGAGAKVKAMEVMMERQANAEEINQLDDAFKGTVQSKKDVLDSSLRLATQPQTVKERVNELNKAINQELEKDYPNTNVLSELEGKLSDIDGSINMAGGSELKAINEKIEGLRADREGLYVGGETGVQLQEKADAEVKINKELKDALLAKQKIRSEVYNIPLENIDSDINNNINKEIKEEAKKEVAEIVSKKPSEVKPKEEVVKEEKVPEKETEKPTEVKSEPTPQKETMVEEKPLPKEPTTSPLDTKKEKPLKKEVDAKEQQSSKMRTEGKPKQTESISDQDMSKDNKPKLQDGKKAESKKLREEYLSKDSGTLINEARSVEELQVLLGEGKVKFGSDFNKKKAALAEEGKFDDTEGRSKIIENLSKDEKTLEKEDLINRLSEKFDKEEEIEMSRPAEAGIAAPSLRGFLDKRAKRTPGPTLKQLRKKWFTSSKGMPKGVHELVKQADAAIRADHYDIENEIKDNVKAVIEDYGHKMTPKVKAELSNAIENIGFTEESVAAAKETILKNIPSEAADVIVKMRKRMDDFSTLVADAIFVGEDLSKDIKSRRGYYMTRTYKKHTDRDWVWKNIPADIKKEAAKTIAELHPEWTSEDNIVAYMKSLLEDKEMVSSIIGRDSSALGMDTTALKKRSKLLTDHESIRKLLGENKDPFFNYSVAMAKMSEMIHRGKLLENVTNLGITNGWLTKAPDDSIGHTRQIKIDNNLYKWKDGTDKLSDYWTTPEIADALETSIAGSPAISSFFRGYLKAVTWVKMSKTVFSWGGSVRNFLGNIINSVGNGNWNFVAIGKEMNERFKDKKGFYRELIANDITGGSASVGDFMAAVKIINDNVSTVKMNDNTVGEDLSNRLIKVPVKFYGLMDDVWKAYRYVSEYTKYQKVYEKKGMSKEEALAKAKSHATEILHKTSTYYSELPLAIQKMKLLPFTNSFISFPYLTLQNYFGTWSIGLKEMKNKDTAHIGIQRLSGSIMAVSTLASIALLKNRMNDQDEDEMAAWRRFLAHYYKNDIIAMKKVTPGKKATYKNMSYLDYYGVLTQPVLTGIRKIAVNGELTTDDLLEITEEFSQSFLSWDILFNRLTSLKDNEDPYSGEKLFLEGDNFYDKSKKITQFIWDTFEPGTLTDAKRINKTYREGGDWQNMMKGVLFGNKVREIEPEIALQKYMLWKYKEELNDSKKIYSRALTRYEKLEKPDSRDKENLKIAKERSERTINKIVEEMIKDKKALKTLRVPNAESKMRKFMGGKDGVGIESSVVKAVYYGRKIRLTDDGKIK